MTACIQHRGATVYLRAGGVAQLVECLPRIHEALALTASTEKVIGKRGLQGYTNHRQTRILDQDG